MIQAEFKRAEDGSIRFVSVSGHAGAAAYGKDVICAAVSMTVINTVNSIEVLSKEDFPNMIVSTDEEKGDISLEFIKTPSEKAGLLLDSMYLGLKTIEKDYNGEFIHITESRY